MGKKSNRLAFCVELFDNTRNQIDLNFDLVLISRYYRTIKIIVICMFPFVNSDRREKRNIFGTHEHVYF